MNIESVHDLLNNLSVRYGDWCAPVTKPYSLGYRNTEGSAILKIYRGITPVQRQCREIQALNRAPACGVKVPRILESGLLGPDAWVVVTVVPGRPLMLSKPADLETYLHHVRTLTQVLANQRPPVAPGDGWDDAHDSRSNSEYLVGMLSPRVRQASWWPKLRCRLADLDGEPLVHLHGDVKPEHILVEDGGVHVVDWEASARGPLIKDEVDAVFHAVRDLEYDSAESDSIASALRVLPSANPSMPPMLAWRVALWADRRRPQDIHRLPGPLMGALLSSTSSGDACAVLAQIIHAMRLTGAPR